MEKENPTLKEQVLLLQAEQKDKLITEVKTYLKANPPANAEQKAAQSRLQEMISNAEQCSRTMDSNGYIQFNQQRQEAIDKLQKRYPRITDCLANIAILLSQGFSTKDIAMTTHTCVRNIQTARLRLRKKMRLRTGADLIKKLKAVIA